MMNALALVLALAAPAAAGTAAQRLPSLDAAAVRALPFETAAPAPAFARDFFGGTPRVRAEGTLYSYDRHTGKYDQATGRACSVTLEDFKSYLDTEHGSPREVVTARYRLEGFPERGGWTSGTAVGSPPSEAYPYVTLEGFQSGGLVTGTRVNILVEGVASAQALLDGQAPPTDVYAVKENSASSYFGGDGVKWGYRCALPGGRP